MLHVQMCQWLLSCSPCPPCPSHPSPRVASFTIQDLAAFTALSTQTPRIPLLLRMSHSELIILCVFADIFEVWGWFCFFFPSHYFAFADIESQLLFPLPTANELWRAGMHPWWITHYSCTLVSFNLLSWPPCPFSLPALILLLAFSKPRLLRCLILQFCCVSSCAL